MNLTTSVAINRIQRILYSGKIVTIDRDRYLIGDGMFDPDNITGQLIPVWGDIYSYNPTFIMIAQLWELVEDKLNFTSVYQQYRKIKIVTGIPWNIGFRKGVVLWPFAYAKGWKSIFPFIHSWYELYVGKPDQVKTSAFYISTLSSSCWMASLCMVLAILGVMWIMFVSSSKSPKSMNVKYFIECFLFISRVMTNRATMKSPSRTSFRIFYITSALFGFMFLIFYSSLLTSKLSVSLTSPPIKNLEDVTRLRTHQLCVQESSYASWKLKMKNGTYLAKWRSLINGAECSGSELFYKACRKKIVILYTMNALEYSDGSKYGSCIAISMKEKLFSSNVVLLASWKFPYTKLINDLMLKIKNVGLHNYWHKKIMYTPPSPYNIKKPYQEVTIANILGLLQYYGAALVLSGCLLIIEMIYHRISANHYESASIFIFIEQSSFE